MSGSSASLNTDGFVGGIYHYLWQKIGGMSCPNVSIPDTVVFKYRQPAYWYFMSVDGSIKMKAQKNITNTNIYEAFRKQRADAVSDIVAYYLSPIEEDEERDVDEQRSSIEFFDEVGLHKFLFHRDKTDTGIIQKFVESKGERNSVIRAIWTPNLCLMERRMNLRKLTDPRVLGYERAVTYEGETRHSESVPINGTVLPAAVQAVSASIVDHLCEADLRISRMVLQLKMDASDKLWVTWCSSMRLQDGPQKVDPVNLAPTFIDRGFAKRDQQVKCPFDGKRHERAEMVSLPYSTIVKVHALSGGTGVPKLLKSIHSGLTDEGYLSLSRDPVFLFRKALVSESCFLDLTETALLLEQSQGGGGERGGPRSPSRVGTSAQLSAAGAAGAAGDPISRGRPAGALEESGILLGRPSRAEINQIDDVYDRLNINTSTSMILKSSEKLETTELTPFY